MNTVEGAIVKKDHLEILMEDMNGKLNILIEGQVALNCKMEAMRTELAEKLDRIISRLS